MSEVSVNEFFRTSGHLLSLLVQQVLGVQVALCKMYLYDEQQGYKVRHSHIKTEHKSGLDCTRAG